MQWFCPECWHEVDETDRLCSACGALLSELDKKSFAEKVMAALRHPEPATSVRAAEILGRLKSPGAVAALMEVLKGGRDPYLLEAAARALGEIGDQASVSALRSVLGSSYLIVRIAAAEALGKIASPEAIEALEAVRGDTSSAVRSALARSLRSLRASAMPRIPSEQENKEESR
jgi:HEAT repeat protein